MEKTPKKAEPEYPPIPQGEPEVYVDVAGVEHSRPVVEGPGVEAEEAIEGPTQRDPKMDPSVSESIPEPKDV